jgi:flagellar biosynthesis/type III secretory pathway protein FliH
VRLGQEEIKAYVEMIEAIVKEWEERKERFFEENELVVVRLAFEIAKKVVHQEISANPDLILYVVREALKKAAGSQNLTVRLNPQDVAVLEKGKEERLPELKKFERLEIVADEKIERGGCILETDSGLLDAQLAVQLKKIEEALLEGSRE